jgi:hypothetical protein
VVRILPYTSRDEEKQILAFGAYVLTASRTWRCPTQFKSTSKKGSVALST